MSKTLTPSDAELAASWVVNMEDVIERNRLYGEHRARRKPIYDEQGNYSTDHSEADAWLVEQYKAAHSD